MPAFFHCKNAIRLVEHNLRVGQILM
jgi:hypothetical protein